MIKKNSLRLFALILPFLVLAYVTFTNYSAQNDNKFWRVEISGFDPRDLLHGRYLNYQIDWDKYGLFKWNRDSKQYMCVVSTDTLKPKISLLAEGHEADNKCDALIQPKEWTERSRKYFIPEEYADALDRAFRDRNRRVFEIDIRVSDDHKLHIGDLYIDGKKMEENIDMVLRRYDRVDYYSGPLDELHMPYTIDRVYYQAENQACFQYYIHWEKFGAIVPERGPTPDLCVESVDPNTKYPTLSLLGRDEVNSQCLSISRAGGHMSSWNKTYINFCTKPKYIDYIIEQSANPMTKTVARIKLFNNGFNNPDMFLIDGEPYKDAFKNR